MNTLTWHGWFAGAIRWVIAPVILFFSGFVTADFLLSELYTWPRTTRVLVLTLTVAVLSYEFVYKEQRAVPVAASPDRSTKALLYSCMIPYALGALTIMGLARMLS